MLLWAKYLHDFLNAHLSLSKLCHLVGFETRTSGKNPCAARLVGSRIDYAVIWANEYLTPPVQGAWKTS